MIKMILHVNVFHSPNFTRNVSLPWKVKNSSVWRKPLFYFSWQFENDFNSYNFDTSYMEDK